MKTEANPKMKSSFAAVEGEALAIDDRPRVVCIVDDLIIIFAIVATFEKKVLGSQTGIVIEIVSTL